MTQRVGWQIERDAARARGEETATEQNARERREWQARDRELNNATTAAGRPRGLGTPGELPAETATVNGVQFTRTHLVESSYVEVYTAADGSQLCQDRQYGQWRVWNPTRCQCSDAVHDTPEAAYADVQGNYARDDRIAAERERRIADPTVLGRMNNRERRAWVATLRDGELVRLANNIATWRRELTPIGLRDRVNRNRADRLAADVASLRRERRERAAWHAARRNGA